jgi:hypothetical protein
MQERHTTTIKPNKESTANIFDKISIQQSALPTRTMDQSIASTPQKYAIPFFLLPYVLNSECFVWLIDKCAPCYRHLSNRFSPQQVSHNAVVKPNWVAAADNLALMTAGILEQNQNGANILDFKMHTPVRPKTSSGVRTITGSPARSTHGFRVNVESPQIQYSQV